jgi:hypothetical protein
MNNTKDGEMMLGTLGFLIYFKILQMTKAYWEHTRDVGATLGKP